MKIHKISAEHLSIERIGEIVYGGYQIQLSNDAQKRIVECRKYLDRKIEETTSPIYGVTTGFGSLCNVSIGPDYLAQLQINLMMSHACGTGDRVPNDIVKIMLLLKIQSLSYGFSGCQLATVNRLIDFFNNDVYPVVYMQGSLGASGDLEPSCCRGWSGSQYSLPRKRDWRCSTVRRIWGLSLCGRCCSRTG